MQATLKAVCPQCGKSHVYIHHGKKWAIFCDACGLTTKYYDSFREADKEWDRLEGKTGR